MAPARTGSRGLRRALRRRVVRRTLVVVRHTEFWERMEQALGSPAYARNWARQQVLRSLDGRTVEEALDGGEPPKHVWRAVWENLELPERER